MIYLAAAAAAATFVLVHRLVSLDFWTSMPEPVDKVIETMLKHTSTKSVIWMTPKHIQPQPRNTPITFVCCTFPSEPQIQWIRTFRNYNCIVVTSDVSSAIDAFAHESIHYNESHLLYKWLPFPRRRVIWFEGRLELHEDRHEIQ